jgi:zinc protease
MKRGRLAAIEQSRTEPSALASRLLERELAPYPSSDVRYVPTIEESIERLQAASHDQIARIYHEYLGSQAGELAIVGDFDPSVCLPILKQSFADWVGKQSYARIASPVVGSGSGAGHRINTPDKENATYLSGMVIPIRDDDPDYPALLIANYVFGGGSLSSRLGNRIRQREGLSYGVGSSLSTSSLDRRASLVTNAICNPANMQKVERAMAEEFERLLRDGISAEELAHAKHGYLQAQRVARSSDSAIASMLANASYVGRTLKYHAELESAIESLTAEQVNAALRKHIVLKTLVIVTAGDFGTTK